MRLSQPTSDSIRCGRRSIIIITKPRTFLSSGGLGTMGYGIGACIGAKTGCPDKICVNIGGRRMLPYEPDTSLQQPADIRFRSSRSSSTIMFWAWCASGRRSFMENAIPTDGSGGCSGLLQGSRSDWDARQSASPRRRRLLRQLKRQSHSQKPVVIDCRIPEDDKVFPMVPAGAAISEVFDGDDLASK